MIKNLIIFSIIILFTGTILYAYSQLVKKPTVSVVLQNEVDIDNPPGTISAIITTDQNISNKKTLLKGTRLIGNIQSLNNETIIKFNESLNTSGEKTAISGMTYIRKEKAEKPGGVSAKISMTLYQQSKTNVLGAIFTNPSHIQTYGNNVLPKGTILQVELE